jgi:hypothetical protein
MSFGSILKRILQVFAHHARLTSVHMPVGIAFARPADNADIGSIAVNGAAIGSDDGPGRRSSLKSARPGHPDGPGSRVFQ